VDAEVTIGVITYDARAGEIAYQVPVVVKLTHAEGDFHVETKCIGIIWPLGSSGDPPPFAAPYMSAEWSVETHDGAPGGASFPVCND
jgi:hypothetical protein